MLFAIAARFRSSNPRPGIAVRAVTRDADGTRRPFESFFERDEVRRQRAKSRRRLIAASIALHVLIFSSLALFSIWDVSEIFPTLRVDVSMVSADGQANAMAAKLQGLRTSTDKAAGMRLRVGPGDVHAGVLSRPANEEASAQLLLRDPGALAYLQNLVSEKLAPKVIYPASLGSKPLRASVGLRLQLNVDGTVAGAEVQKPCPNDALCRAVLSAVESAAPFAPHSGKVGAPWVIAVPVEFVSPGP